MLYPFIFEPIVKAHPWGGRNLERIYHKPLPPEGTMGESWEIADRPEAVSVVANGPLAGKDLRWLMEHHGPELLGAAQPVNGRFPLLVKILDAHQAPSIQVHPPAEIARRLGGESKTELWYITEAGRDGVLHVGLKAGIKRQQFERKIGDGSVADCLHTVRVRSGDAMFLPSGRVHAIGAGIVLFEIQQNSDTTYRIFDWSRVGSDGKPRAVHVEQAMASIDFDDIEPALVGVPLEERDGGQTRVLAEDPAFAVQEWRVSSEYNRTLGAADRPTILAVVSGTIEVRHAASDTNLSLGPGQFCLIPASVEGTTIMAATSATFLLAQPGVASVASEETAHQQERQAVAAWQVYETRRQQRAEASEPHAKGILPSGRRLKMKLGKHLTYAPFIKLLLFSFWFRLVVLALAGVAFIVVLLFPKMWTSTPKDFVPVVKVSLLDKIQAFNLRRTAEKAMARRDYEGALTAWGSAYANNQGNPEMARGLLRTVIAQRVNDRKHLVAALRASSWLLRLTSTNAADLELVVQFYDRAQFYDQIYDLLHDRGTQRTPSEHMLYVKSLFFEGQHEVFARLWEQLPPDQRSHPELRLLYAAHQAGWGAPDVSGEGKAELLKAAVEASPERVFANRLLMAVAVYRNDLALFTDCFVRVREANADSGVENANYWRLLAMNGQKPEAVRLAKDYVFPPKSSRELLRMASAYVLLDMKEEALKLLRRYTMTFGFSEDLWLLYARLLEDAKEWEELRDVSLQLRAIPYLRARLEGMSHYYEGRADHATGRSGSAAAAFDRASGAAFPQAQQGVNVARSMIILGFPAPARRVLETVEKNTTNRNEYLNLMFNAAMQLKDSPLMVETARELFELRPNSAELANRYAAALLIDREERAEALQITLRIVLQFPQSIAARINHCLALLWNSRADEAETLLNSVLPIDLRREDLNSYYMALLDLHFQKGRFGQAWEALDRVNLAELYPKEAAYIDGLRSQLPPRGQP
ncbi:MAG TPA: hypothetical protein PKM73_03890 [Verrucomicrobiota bacterium]|nr:hypothetical protein [Verrucomicrobiota bacterium]HNU50798.1 hypothetical protein [Verrucomicrobiota bacterium]